MHGEGGSSRIGVGFVPTRSMARAPRRRAQYQSAGRSVSISDSSASPCTEVPPAAVRRRTAEEQIGWKCQPIWDRNLSSVGLVRVSVKRLMGPVAGCARTCCRSARGSTARGAVRARTDRSPKKAADAADVSDRQRPRLILGREARRLFASPVSCPCPPPPACLAAAESRVRLRVPRRRAMRRRFRLRRLLRWGGRSRLRRLLRWGGRARLRRLLRRAGGSRLRRLLRRLGRARLHRPWRRLRTRRSCVRFSLGAASACWRCCAWRRRFGAAWLHARRSFRRPRHFRRWRRRTCWWRCCRSAIRRSLPPALPAVGGIGAVAALLARRGGGTLADFSKALPVLPRFAASRQPGASPAFGGGNGCALVFGVAITIGTRSRAPGTPAGRAVVVADLSGVVVPGAVVCVAVRSVAMGRPGFAANAAWRAANGAARRRVPRAIVARMCRSSRGLAVACGDVPTTAVAAGVTGAVSITLARISELRSTWSRARPTGSAPGEHRRRHRGDRDWLLPIDVACLVDRRPIVVDVGDVRHVDSRVGDVDAGEVIAAHLVRRADRPHPGRAGTSHAARADRHRNAEVAAADERDERGRVDRANRTGPGHPAPTSLTRAQRP